MSIKNAGKDLIDKDPKMVFGYFQSQIEKVGSEEDLQVASELVYLLKNPFMVDFSKEEEGNKRRSNNGSEGKKEKAIEEKKNED